MSPESIDLLVETGGQAVKLIMGLIASAHNASEQQSVEIQQRLDTATAALKGEAEQDEIDHAELTKETEQILKDQADAT